MIHLFKANSLTLLAKKLSEDLRDSSNVDNPFAMDWIVVQNKETQTWLQLEISRLNGISANLKFVYPSELAWQLIRTNQPDIPVELPTDRIAIQSRVFDLLISERTELLKCGLIVPGDVSVALNLSESIADVFDLYQVFRPDLLQKWTSGRNSGLENEKWQCFIWRKIISSISESFPEIPKRFELDKLLDQSIKSNSEALPNKLHIFGLSHWSESYFKIIKSLSSAIVIKWYDQQLSDIGLHESRIREWVKPKKEVQRFFKSLKPEEYLESSVDHDESKYPEMKIHSCYNVEREVQILRNELLAYLENYESSTVDDILIMVPDFEKYAPIIQNEFSSTNRFPSIPVYIPDSQFDSSTDFIIDLLKFYQNGEKVTDFLELISHPKSKEAFELTELEIIFYQTVFAEMNIHFGLTKKDAVSSLEKGIDQLLLSFSMLETDYELLNGDALIQLRSTADVKTYVSKLALFHRKLAAYKSLLNQRNTLLTWLIQFRNFLSGFLPGFAIAFKKIDKLIKQLEYSSPITEVPFEAFQNWFITKLAEQNAISTKRGSGVLVSSYIPYRNLPFRFVAILGLGEGSFPRNVYRPDFDLIHRSPRPGDRITKKDDALLFLERVCSTKEYLHLSYIGEGEQKTMPSTLVQELIDMKPDLAIVHHKLHGFGNSSDKEGPIYPNLETEISTLVYGTDKVFQDRFAGEFELLNNKDINLVDFIQFFTHPSKHLLSTILGMRSILEESVLSDREDFVMSGLSKYHLKKDLVEFHKKSDGLDKFQNYQLAKGKLPRGATGNHQLLEQNSLVELVNERVKDFISQEEKSIDFSLEVSTIKIFGKISDLYNQERVSWKISTIKPHDLIDLWLKHLILCIENPAMESSMLIGFNEKKELIEYRFEKIFTPLEKLEDYLKIYTSEKPSKYHWSCIPSLANKCVEFIDEPDRQSSEIGKAWYSTEHVRKEDSDFYNQLLWKDELPWQNECFMSYADIIWKPIYNHLEVSIL